MYYVSIIEKGQVKEFTSLQAAFICYLNAKQAIMMNDKEIVLYEK